MDLKIVSCGNRTSLYSRSLPSGKPQRILSVIQCSPVRPKLLCTVHGRHSIRTCGKIPNRREKDILSYRFLSFDTEHRFTSSPMTARNNSIRFHLHRYRIEFGRETGGTNLLFVHVLECVAFAGLLVAVFFWLRNFASLIGSAQYVLVQQVRWLASTWTKVLRLSLEICFFLICFLFQWVKWFESNYYTPVRQRAATLMFRRQYVVHVPCALTVVYVFHRDMIRYGCGKQGKGEMVKIECPCCVSHRSSIQVVHMHAGYNNISEDF